MTTFDRLSWHSEGDFPRDVPSSQGATHIGMYLVWCAENDLLTLDPEVKASLDRHRGEGQLTPSHIAIELFDGALRADVLSTEGAAFTEAYYDPDDDDDAPSYFDDYANEFCFDGETIYHVPDDWRSYERIVPWLTERFSAWRGARPPQ